MSGPNHNGGPLSEGWIARHRTVRDHWLVGHGIHVKPADPTRKRCHTQGEAWEDMLMECRYAEGTVNNGGRKMELRRGELLGAVSWLANRWNWTPKTVRRFLDQLENDGMIELKNPALEKGNQIGRQANVITVCNYEEYQSGTAHEGQSKGQPEGNQRATRGQPEGNIYKEEQRNKGTKEQEIPPSPRGGAEPKKSKRNSREFTAAEMALTDAAVKAYNDAAEVHGFYRATVVDAVRRRRVLTRVMDIGGLDNFRLALSAIPSVPFLMGQTTPRPNQEPFRLDIDRLLSDGSQLGNVLAKLVDKASSANSAPSDPQAVNGKPWGWWRGKEDRLRTLSMNGWRAAFQSHRPNGTWPWWLYGPPPGHPECFVPPELIAEHGWEEIYRGNITHD